LLFCNLQLEGPRPHCPPRGYPATLRTLGSHLRKCRIDLGLGQRTVAQRLGVLEETVGFWARGLCRPLPRHYGGIVRFLGYEPEPGLPTWPGASGPSAAGRVRARPSLTFRVLGNPGREVVRLAVTLGSQEVVRVAIYDVSGRVVGEVPGEVLPAGEHVLSWTAGGRNIKPGVYFAVLDAGGQSRVAKFVLLR